MDDIKTLGTILKFENDFCSDFQITMRSLAKMYYQHSYWIDHSLAGSEQLG